MPFAPSNGLRFYYEEHGEGEPLLLIMGQAATAALWARNVPALSKHYRTIVYDPRGTGQTDAAPGPYSTSLLADDAAGLLEALGIARARVAGVSLGGMVAQELALRCPERVERLALLSTFARPRRPLFDWWEDFGAWASARGPDLRGFTLWFGSWFYSPAFFQDPEAVEVAVEQSAATPTPISAETFAAQAAAVLSADTLDRLPSLRCPTLVLVGREDILTPVYYAEELAGAIPGARLRVLDRGGHGAFFEFAGEVNRELIAFFGGA